MKTYFRHMACLVPVLITLSGQPALAQSATAVQDNAAERINLSGKLRMLSQRIPSAACHYHRGIDPQGAGELLAAASAEFESILAALENGDPNLNIHLPETRRKTLAQIAVVREIWEPIRHDAEAVVAGMATEQEINSLLVENIALLGAAQRLVEELVKQYANPNAATRASLMLIDISGRQRMLTQKLSKEACILGGPFETNQTQSDLEGTAQIFEASLEALRFGMPQVGILPPPNPAIAAGLSGVLDDWNSVKPLVTRVTMDTGLTGDEHVAKFRGLNVTMANMNTVVGMYSAQQ